MAGGTTPATTDSAFQQAGLDEQEKGVGTDSEDSSNSEEVRGDGGAELCSVTVIQSRSHQLLPLLLWSFLSVWWKHPLLLASAGVLLCSKSVSHS